MFQVDSVVEPSVDPLRSVATDRHLMRVVARPVRARSPVLRVYACPGDMLLLGRYHLSPSAVPGARVRVGRRLCGGRALPFGDGFVGLSLVLPHRSALVATERYALTPAQVLNRCVRGVMEACRLADLPVYYPGRDVLTVNRRAIAALSLETDDQGALLFETILATGRDFGVLADWLEQVDPSGVVKTDIALRENSTSLARELGTPLDIAEVADLLCRGFAQQFQLALTPHTLSPLEHQAIDAVLARELRPEDWIQRRARRADLDRHAAAFAQLGTFEVFLAVQSHRFLKEVMFAGDFIANSPAVETLERRLRLCPLEWAAIDAVATEIFSNPEHFILGIGKQRTIADLIMRGATG
jgi:lipoate-protein ligase A